MRLLVTLLATFAGGTLAFPVFATIAGAVMIPVRWALVALGVHFDPYEDDDPASMRMVAATIGLAVAMGIACAVVGVGELAAPGGTLRAAGVSGALVAGRCAARWSMGGFAGLSAYAFVLPATAVGAAVACVVAALT
ncbi:MAG: hypothetical protein R3B36_00605 [Polyangiaceae bacterium]